MRVLFPAWTGKAEGEPVRPFPHKATSAFVQRMMAEAQEIEDKFIFEVLDKIAPSCAHQKPHLECEEDECFVQGVVES